MRWPTLLPVLVPALAALSLIAGPGAPVRAAPSAPAETAYCAHLKTQSLSFDRMGEPVADTAATFKCAKASTDSERLICSSHGLAAADLSLGYHYCGLLARLPPAERARLADDQRAWLRSRQACHDETCLSALYDAQDRKFSARLTTIDLRRRIHLRKPGDCEATRVEDTASRFEGVPLGGRTDGSSIAFADGVSVVSYGVEPAILKSRIGDKARVCLVSIPQHCPKGDDRGRVYSAANLRTGDRLKLPDSEHSCGGA
jgi:uncharacterized protein YecT (DUF1311 family)